MLNLQRNARFPGMALVLALLASGLAAQQVTGILRGLVTDESGALIPAASLVISGPGGVRRNVQSQADGTYNVVGLPPGTYTVRLALAGFSPFEAQVEVGAGRTQQLNIALRVQAEKQEVTVKGEPGPQVSVEPDNNAGALVLRGADLDALSDDPDDLAADLQALAGPSAGPNGGQIFIDGFSGGSLPPKENIREIRINQNPFSAEYDQLGYGRIEILTKPGTDKYHGSAFYYGGDDIFNARYPFAPEKADYLSKMYGGLITGPVTRKSSFTFDVEKRDINDGQTVSAQTLDQNFDPVPFSQVVPTPTVRTSIGPRLDYALTPNNTLVGRYTYMHSGADNTGVGGFNLETRGYDTSMTEQRLQVTETSVLAQNKVVNETRLQFLRSALNQTGDNSLPAINVNEAFNGGGAQIGHTTDLDNRWEIQNYTTTTRRTHTFRFGARVRTETQSNVSPNNFGGTFSYGGGIAPVLGPNDQPVGDPAACVNVAPNALPSNCQQISSLERYRRTQEFSSQGMSAAQVRLLGGNPTLFTISAGNPLASVTQTDIGAFIQDDWRVKPNLTLSLGLRYETQTNISDFRDVAPRIGVAWAPGARGGKNAKTVFRGGSGFFYTRFDNGYSLNALRYNGITEQTYNVVNPNFLVVPPLGTLSNSLLPSSRTIVDSNLHSPLIWQSTISIERQLPKNTTVATTLVVSRGTHMLMSRDINSPIAPGGPRPYGNVGEIFEYEAAGRYNQKQWMTNVNSRVSRKISLFGYYTLNYAKSNTDGVATFPANQYNLATEYGRSSLDRRHRGFIGGSVTTPLALRFSPYISINSGMPFNITTGRDFYGDTKYTDRPSLATAGQPGAIVTQWGVFNPNPGPNDPRIPRNYGSAPGYFTVNLRVSRTFGFGPTRGNTRNNAMSDGGPGDHGPGGDRGGRGSSGGRGPGGPGGGGPHMSGGGRGFGGGDSGSTEHRYNITISANAHNLLNHFNPGAPIGNLTSPLFGTANTTGGFGFGGSSYSSSQAYNRHMELSLRFTF